MDAKLRIAAAAALILWLSAPSPRAEDAPAPEELKNELKAIKRGDSAAAPNAANDVKIPPSAAAPPVFDAEAPPGQKRTEKSPKDDKQEGWLLQAMKGASGLRTEARPRGKSAGTKDESVFGSGSAGEPDLLRAYREEEIRAREARELASGDPSAKSALSLDAATDPFASFLARWITPRDLALFSPSSPSSGASAGAEPLQLGPSAGDRDTKPLAPAAPNPFLAGLELTATAPDLHPQPAPPVSPPVVAQAPPPPEAAPKQKPATAPPAPSAEDKKYFPQLNRF